MIVLDTHAWVWWLGNPRRLSPRARKAIAQAMDQGSVHVSSISTWEVALLVERGRLELTMAVDDWLARAEALPFMTFVPVDNRIALTAVRLPPPFHADPADRIIVATAMTLGATLVTRDERIRAYPLVRTLW